LESGFHTAQQLKKDGSYEKRERRETRAGSKKTQYWKTETEKAKSFNRMIKKETSQQHEMPGEKKIQPNRQSEAEKKDWKRRKHVRKVIHAKNTV